MSRTYLEIVLLVLAAFTLGLFVGWLAWHDAARSDEAHLTTAKARDVRRQAADEHELPRWQGEQLPSASPPPSSHRSASSETGSTVIVGPEGNATAP